MNPRLCNGTYQNVSILTFFFQALGGCEKKLYGAYQNGRYSQALRVFPSDKDIRNSLVRISTLFYLCEPTSIARGLVKHYAQQY